MPASTLKINLYFTFIIWKLKWKSNHLKLFLEFCHHKYDRRYSFSKWLTGICDEGWCILVFNYFLIFAYLSFLCFLSFECKTYIAYTRNHSYANACTIRVNISTQLKILIEMRQLFGRKRSNIRTWKFIVARSIIPVGRGRHIWFFIQIFCREIRPNCASKLQTLLITILSGSYTMPFLVSNYLLVSRSPYTLKVFSKILLYFQVTSLMHV